MFRENIRRQLARGIRYIVRPFGQFDLSVVYAMDLTQPLKEFKARIPIGISHADEDDIDELLDMNPYHNRQVIAGRLRAGAKCFVARIDGRIIGFNWIGFNSVRDDEFNVRLKQNDVYCLDARVAENFRGMGIHTELLFAMLVYSRHCGFKTAYTRVSAMHRDSWKTHLRLGWREVGTTYFFNPHSNNGFRFQLTGPLVYPVEVFRKSITV